MPRLLFLPPSPPPPPPPGYQYGKISWNEANLALLITEEDGLICSVYRRCVAKCYDTTQNQMCLKLCEIFTTHQGNMSLLRKLQALGLHPTR